MRNLAPSPKACTVNLCHMQALASESVCEYRQECNGSGSAHAFIFSPDDVIKSVKRRRAKR